MSLQKSVLQEGTWFASVRLAGIALSATISVLLARVLTPTDYGLLAMATAFTGAAALINECGLGPAIVQRREITDAQLSSCFWLSLAWSSALYGAIFVSAPLVASFFADTRLLPVLRLIGLDLVIGSAGVVPDNMLMRTMSFRKRSLADFIAIVVRGGIAYLLAVCGWGVWSLVLGSLTGSVASILSLFIFFPWRPTGGLRLRQIGDMLNFGANITGSRVLWYSYSNADNVVVAKFLNAQALGFYSMAYDLATRPLQRVTMLIHQLGFPVFSRKQDDIDIIRRYFLRATGYVAMLALPAMAGAIVVAPDLIDALLGRKWSPMTTPFRLLCAVSALQAVAAIIPPLLNARGNARANFRYSLVCFAVMPPSLLVGVRFGLNAVAVTWLIVYPCLFGYLLSIGLREIGLSIAEYVRALLPTVGITAVMVVAVTAFRSAAVGYLDSPATLVVSILIGLVTYGGVLVLTSDEMRSGSLRALAALRP